MLDLNTLYYLYGEMNGGVSAALAEISYWNSHCISLFEPSVGGWRDPSIPSLVITAQPAIFQFIKTVYSGQNQTQVNGAISDRSPRRLFCQKVSLVSTPLKFWPLLQMSWRIMDGALEDCAPVK
jgi:hypothetical protein